MLSIDKNKMIKFFKEKFLPIAIIIVLIYWINYNKKMEDSKLIVSGIGKVYNYTYSASSDRYYDYKYFYKDKLYKSSEPVDEINFSLIGKCFEVLINPDDPDKSKLNLEKELDCSIYTPRWKKNYQGMKQINPENNDKHLSRCTGIIRPYSSIIFLSQNI